jgi:hypothetical protein
VRLTDTEQTLVVTVREGTVAAVHGGRSHRARAGQALTIRSDGHVESRIASTWGPGWDWVAAAGPGFTLEGRTVRELLAWVAEETGWRIELTDEVARDAQSVVLHGDLGALGADRAAFAVLPGAGLEAELSDGTLVVRAAR